MKSATDMGMADYGALYIHKALPCEAKLALSPGRLHLPCNTASFHFRVAREKLSFALGKTCPFGFSPP